MPIVTKNNYAKFGSDLKPHLDSGSGSCLDPDPDPDPDPEANTQKFCLFLNKDIFYNKLKVLLKVLKWFENSLILRLFVHPDCDQGESKLHRLVETHIINDLREVCLLYK